jgi:site-specific recombinase XerC
MPYVVQREVQDSHLVRLSVGIPLVDDYLEFLHCHARPNTWLNYAHDLKVFFSLVDKPVPAVTTSDVFRFMERQQRPRPADAGGDPPRGVCARTLKRRLCAVSNLYTYLLLRDDTPVTHNPVPAGLPVRGQMLGTARRSVPLIRTP